MIRITQGSREIWLADHHAIYERTIFHHFAHYFTAVVPREDGGRLIVDYSRPALHRLIDFDDCTIVTRSFLEPIASTRRYLDALQVAPGHTVWDLGANVGVATILFAAAVGAEGRVVSIEPDPFTIPCFHRNVIEWQLSHRQHGRMTALAMIPGAIADVGSDGMTIAFSGDGTPGAGLTGIVGRRGTVHRAPAFTLEDVCVLTGWTPTSIKVDIEGAELDMLRNLDNRRFLRTHKPRLVIEPHKVYGAMNTDRLVEELLDLDYDTRTLTAPGDPYDLLLAVPAGDRRAHPRMIDGEPLR